MRHTKERIRLYLLAATVAACLLLAAPVASPAPPASGPSAPPAIATFVGSAKCQSCHTGIFASWQKTRMANVVRDPRVHPEAVLGDFTSKDPTLTFGLAKVAIVYGSRWKQRYFTLIGDDFFVLPAQWDIAKKKWLPFHVEDNADWWTVHYGKDNMQRPTGPLCDGCHSTNYNIATKKVTEWNVGCEKCHGPGSLHAAHPTTANIVDSARLSPELANDTCLQCHSQGRPKANPIAANAGAPAKWYDWPVGYLPGQRLADIWTLEDSRPGATTFYHFPDGTAHKNRMQGNDYVQALMSHRSIKCSNCHSVHADEHVSMLRTEGNALCLDCHSRSGVPGPGVGPDAEQTVAQHTHHAESSPASQCTACHMPRIETTLPGTFVAAHTFRFISPRLTQQFGMPNACNQCHADKDPAWALQALSTWTSNASPWPLASATPPDSPAPLPSCPGKTPGCAPSSIPH